MMIITTIIVTIIVIRSLIRARVLLTLPRLQSQARTRRNDKDDCHDDDGDGIGECHDDDDVCHIKKGERGKHNVVKTTTCDQFCQYLVTKCPSDVRNAQTVFSQTKLSLHIYVLNQLFPNHI